jgi:beta-glucosidase
LARRPDCETDEPEPTATISFTSAPCNSSPAGFFWGAATAAHQIEGNNVNSDFWFLENIKPTTFVERSGDACDSYHRYQEDIAFLAELRLTCYRFSIEWARIEPTRGHLSVAELDHYKRMIECYRSHGLAPAVTFMHCTAPLWFATAGGWLNPDAPAYFADYCSNAAQALSDGMSFAFTLNEPQVRNVFRCIPGAEAYFESHDPLSRAMHAQAAQRLSSLRFSSMEDPDLDAMTPQPVAAHEQGYQAIKAERGNLPVGVTLSVTDFQPGGEGGPFEEVRKKAYGEWLDTSARIGDFTGVQTYRTIRIPGTGEEYPAAPVLPFTEPGDRPAEIQRPKALGNTVDYVHSQTNKPVFVTENGLETDNDERRVWYIHEALSGLHAKIEAGVPVMGYLHWSLLDNFEWTRGYGPKMGLASVDPNTFARSPKPSAARLGAIARQNAL